MLELITTISLLAIGYAYFGYPILLKLIVLLRGEKTTSAQMPEVLPTISIIIAARNEAAVLTAKLEQTLSLEYFGKERELIEVIVASDASDDGSDEIVRNYSHRGVKLARLTSRAGKEAAQKLALDLASGEIILFTDAKIELNRDALERIVTYFSDPQVGIISSVDKIAEVGDGSGEGFYIKYEMWLRKLESAFSNLVGVSGSAFAVRKEICAEWSDDIPSDFALLINAIKRGYRGILVQDFCGTYRTVKTEEEEFSRKIRTVLRGISTIFRRREVFNITHFGSFSFQIISHKLCRWLVPFFIIFATIGLCSLASHGAVYAALALMMIAAYLAAVLAYYNPRLREKRIFKIPLFFLVSNAAILVAWILYFTGKRSVQWTPSQKV